MAKKQGISYGPNASLIQGAATAYRNYDNMPGMYAGLDKVTEAGMGVVDEAVKGYEAEQEKLEKEAKEAQAKADQLNDNWNSIAAPVFELAGGFMKDVEYKDTVASVKALRQEYLDAQNSKDAEKMAEVKIKFNNINTEITAHKEFRAKLAHPEYGMSDFVTGDNREYMNGFINEDYVIGRDDKTKEKTYTVNGVTKTMEEINKMVDVKNMKPYADYGKLVNDYSTSKTKGNKNNLLLSIRNLIVPDQENPLRAFLNDKGFGNGQTFSDLLKTDVNRASVEKEIMGGAFDNEEDSKGVISKSEYDNFINAIVNPDNEFWKNNGGASAWKDQSRTIATELLANGAENAWTDNPANKPVVTTDGIKTDTNPYGIPKDGLRLGDMIDNRYQIEVRQDLVTGYINDIKAGGDFKFLQNDYSFVDGNWYENYGTKPNDDGQGGEFKYDSTQAMTDDVFQTGGKYFDGLETKIQIDPRTGKPFNETAKKSKIDPLELSALGNAKSAREVFEKIQATYKTKNEAIKTATGSIGGLSARKSGQSIYIMVDGVEKEFSLGSAGGFGGTSVNPGKRTDYLTNLESLLNAVNGSLNPEYVNTDYNSTNTETN